MKEQSVGGERSIRANVALESAGAIVSRYGLVVILLLIGILKFTPAEADGIQPLVAHSPFMSWMYLVVSKQGVSNFIGVVELLIALLLALRPISPRASFIGSLGAITTFLLTTSFLFSTPGAIQLGQGVEILMPLAANCCGRRSPQSGVYFLRSRSVDQHVERAWEDVHGIPCPRR